MTIRQGKILIVDDNEDILFTLKMLLRPRVENITTCSDPKEINRLVSRNQYDVILLDMNFTTDAVSGKEGFYWLERILEIAPDTVVILITAYSDTTIFCRSNGLVRSIESYRKVTGIPIPVLEIISVNYFLNDICLLFKNLEDKIKIIPTTAHLQVIADKGLIEQVLINLMENALIHSGSTEPVDLIIRELDDAISFSVRDYGRGLSEDLLPHIFEGGQVSSGSSDSHRGMGIGLSICQTIIQAHGGQITAVNHTGDRTKGAEFTFTLPKEKES